MSSLAACSTGKSGSTLSVDAARLRAIAAACPVAGHEALPLDQAVGRVTATPIMAAHALPPFDNSAMDGYALRLSDLTGESPWHLPASVRIAAGDARTLTQQLYHQSLLGYEATWSDLIAIGTIGVRR